MNLAPILLFTYNRPWHTEKTLKALAKNSLAKKSHLYIFCDGIKNYQNQKETQKNDEVKKLLSKIDKSQFKKVTICEAKENKGLKNSIINGVTKIISQYQKVIVIEDDIVVNPYFLDFMNDALLFYENDKKIFSLSGYCPSFRLSKDYQKELFLFYRFSSWGWATWLDRWEKINFNLENFLQIKKNKYLKKSFNRGGDDLYDMLYDQQMGKIDSWAIYFCYSQSLNNGFTIYPIKSIVQNIGLDNCGTHTSKIKQKYFRSNFDKKFLPKIENLQLNKKIVKEILKCYKLNFFLKIKKKIKYFLNL